VEFICHPGLRPDYEFLLSGKLRMLLDGIPVARGFVRGASRTCNEVQHGRKNAVDEKNAIPEVVWMKVPESTHSLPHICVCICTYKRPEPLMRLLESLRKQKTNGQFTFSIVIADNDAEESGRATVEAFQRISQIPVKYILSPERGIARTRNRVLANAEGDYLAFIDDDEFAIEEWLLRLLETCLNYGTDGVLGPVLRHFDGNPPRWLVKSRFFVRPVMPTGMAVHWNGSRTGNVLMRSSVIAGDAEPFNPEIRAGSDRDFFVRRIEAGCRFVWSAEAIAYEVIPPERWTRMYQIRRSVLIGEEERKMGTVNLKRIVKALIAVPLYMLMLPFLLLLGQHRFMDYLVRLCEHGARLLSLLGLRILHGAYNVD
jgi:succinoglycan biosynthesis protein ExoM